MIAPPDAWILSRALAGHELNGERDRLTGPVRRMVDHLCELAPDARTAAWGAMLAAREDGPELVKALAGVDPSGTPPPEPEPPPRRRPANLADIRNVSKGVQWLWEGYIPAARISGIAAYEGVGKTRLAMDLARRVWHALDWPDGQPATLPPGTPTLWVCADGQQDDLLTAADALELPDEAVLFNTPHDEAYGGTELDAPEDRERLEEFIGEVRPGLVFIDTLTNATSFDLCKAQDTKALMTPLRDIAQRTGVSIIPLMHLSKEGHALGRRIKGLTRTIIHLECPDPEQSGRLRLWVPKTFAKKPPALGVTMGDGGNRVAAQ
jgi:hypothetical protein